MAGTAELPLPNVAPLNSRDPRSAGPYRLLGRLGQGGQGVVYIGVDAHERRVAVKTLNIDLQHNPRAKAQFAKEITAARRVAPFCTAQILFAELDTELPYVVSEFIEGPTLHRQVRDHGPLAPNALYRLAVGTATALAAIHQAGIVHCDLKPDNVILGGDGPRVIDFGIARALGTETMSGHVMGTVPYMAPERFHNVDVGPRCDVFGWAAMIGFAAAGRAPFGHDSMATVMSRVLHEEPDLENLSGTLLDLVRECLAKDQYARPTAEQVLLRLLGHAAPAAPVPLVAALQEGSDAATSVLPQAPASAPPGTGPTVPAVPAKATARLPVDPGQTPPAPTTPQPTVLPPTTPQPAVTQAAPPHAAPPSTTVAQAAPPHAAFGQSAAPPFGPPPPGGHGAPPRPPRRRRRLPVVIGAVVGIALVAGGYVYVNGGLGDRTDCVPLEVVSSTEKSDLVADLARRYEDGDRRFGGRCADVTVTGITSGKVMEALAGDWAELSGSDRPEPQVWLPTSTLWTGQLRLLDQAAGNPEQTPGEFPSIANSPLVIAMPASKARFLQQQGALGWGDILGMSGQQGWAAFGKPEWKRFTFGKDNPNLSTSGLAATIATYYAATGTSNDLTLADLQRPAVTQFVRRIEANVSHYSDDVVDLLRALAAADLTTVESGPAAADLSAVVTQEELVYLYNEGKLSPKADSRPRDPLVALFPKEGTFNLDHPYVVLPRAAQAQRDAAADFLAFLQEDAQQEAFAALGFRDHERTASAKLIEVVGGHEAADMPYFEPPAPKVVQGIKAGWSTLRKKANILLTVDVSGSMVANSVDGQTRLDYATDAAKKGIALLNSEDRVGLWSFSSEQAGERLPYRQQLPLGRLDVAGFGAKLDAMKSGGRTALYATVRAAHAHMLKNYDRNRINAVVVLTDGENEYDKDKDLAKLLRDVELDPDRPVKIFCIAFDEQSDLTVLKSIAQAGAGKAFDAQNPRLVDEAFVKLLSSF